MRTALVLCTVLLAFTAETGADGLSWGIVVSSAADLGTTEWALSRPGTYELNPLLQGPTQRAVLKTLFTAGAVGGYELLKKKHPKKAKRFAIAAISVWGAAALMNTYTALRRRD